MRSFRMVVALVLVVALAASASAAKGNKAGKKAGKHVKGQVVAIDKANNTITVKVGAHKKDPTAQAVEKTIKVNDATTYEEVTGKKDQRQSTSVKFDDLQVKQHVRIQMNGDVASDVQIHHHGKKGKKKAA